MAAQAGRTDQQPGRRTVLRGTAAAGTLAAVPASTLLRARPAVAAVRDPDTNYPYGIAVFDVDPGRLPGARTTITVSYFHTATATAANPFPAPVLHDRFTVHRNRRDTHRGSGEGHGHDDRQVTAAR